MSSRIFINGFNQSTISSSFYIPNFFRAYDKTSWSCYEDQFINDPTLTLPNQLLTGNVVLRPINEILEIMSSLTNPPSDSTTDCPTFNPFPGPNKCANPDYEKLRNQLISFSLNIAQLSKANQNRKVACGQSVITWCAYYTATIIPPPLPFFPTIVIPAEASQFPIPTEELIAYYNDSVLNRKTSDLTITGYQNYFNLIYSPSYSAGITLKSTDLIYISLVTFEVLYEISKLKLEGKELGINSDYKFTYQNAYELYSLYNPLTIQRVNSTLGKVIGRENPFRWPFNNAEFKNTIDYSKFIP